MNAEGSTGTDSIAIQRRSLRALEWLNFFMADVQTGLGPFIAAYLAANGWNPQRVGFALTLGGLVTVAMQTPAGALVDRTHQKRLLIAINVGLLAIAALLLRSNSSTPFVYSGQLLIGAAAPFLAPAAAAIALGIVGAEAFDRQFGKNQAFNAAGNVVTALLIAYLSYRFGSKVLFTVAAAMVIPTLFCLAAIDSKAIDYARSRGARETSRQSSVEGLADLLRNRALILFCVTAFLFHFSNAAMLPQLGEFLSRSSPKLAAPFMSACIIVTQCVITVSAASIGRWAGRIGRKPLLLIGFGVLPIRGVLYTLTHLTSLLIGIQILDGVANAIFGIVSILIIKDLTRGTGHFNLASGALATMVGIGAALSNLFGGILVQRWSYTVSFLGLSAIATVALVLLLFGIPETVDRSHAGPAADFVIAEE